MKEHIKQNIKFIQKVLGLILLGKTEGLNNESSFILPKVCLPEVLPFVKLTLVLFFWKDIKYLSYTFYDTSHLQKYLSEKSGECSG
jgi:hypothetical protein